MYYGCCVVGNEEVGQPGCILFKSQLCNSVLIGKACKLHSLVGEPTTDILPCLTHKRCVIVNQFFLWLTGP